MRTIQILNASAAQLTGINSVPIFIGDSTNFGIAITFTDNTSEGTIIVQESFDSILWTNAQGFTPGLIVVASATPGSRVVTQFSYQVSMPWYRVNWTSTAGAGTITIDTVFKQTYITGTAP
jgi:hypothetical protein